MTLRPFLASLCLLSALSFVPAEAMAASKQYVLVGVSGYKTGRADAERMNIYSNKICKDCEESGVWTFLNFEDRRIAKRVYLTHYSQADELAALMELFTDPGSSRCRSDRGLIVMANSWGAELANDVSNQYFRKCGERTEMFIMVDGIQKPLFFAFSSPITADKCVNLYQTSDFIHGGPIPQCTNTDLLKAYPPKKSPKSAHVWAEWEGSKLGAILIALFLKAPK